MSKFSLIQFFSPSGFSVKFYHLSPLCRLDLFLDFFGYCEQHF